MRPACSLAGRTLTHAVISAAGQVVFAFSRAMYPGAAAFRDNVILARDAGSSWKDPEMRAWESGGHSEQADFDWSA